MTKTKQNIIRLIPNEAIIRKIYLVRGHKIMLDFDLSALYEVETKAFNQAVKRNIERFPDDFMFRLTEKEWLTMRSQIVTASTEDSSQKKRNVTATPYAFTEHGVTMLASVLKSERAVKMSIAVVRAFIELKRSALKYDELAGQLQSLKEHLGEHDAQLNQIYDAIENLLDEKLSKKAGKKGIELVLNKIKNYNNKNNFGITGDHSKQPGLHFIFLGQTSLNRRVKTEH